MSDALALQRAQLRGHAPGERPQLLAVGVMIWLGSEFMFFSSLFAAFFTIRAHAPIWPPADPHLDTYQALIFSAVLLVSSPTMQVAVWAQENGHKLKAKIWLGVSFFLGAMFLGNQGYEWITLPFSPSTGAGAYGSLFFIMSGLHGLHVLLGLVAMIALFGRIKGPTGDPGETSVFQAVSYYWHFVDIVWIGLFSALFLFS